MNENQPLPNRDLIELCKQRLLNENIYAEGLSPYASKLYSALLILNNNFYSDILPNGSFDLAVGFLQNVTDIMFVYLKESLDRNEKVVE